MDRRQHWRVNQELRMARHARFGRWNSCKVALFYRRMTVTAINAVAANVPLVAKRDRLLAVDADLRDQGRPVQCAAQKSNDCRSEHSPDDRHAK